jgi:myo-inositol-1(or 4)-monophosphatase
MRAITPSAGRAWLNGERIHVTATDRLIDSMLVTGFPYDMNEMDNNLKHFADMSHKCIPSAAWVRRARPAYVAAGRLDGYWEIGVSAWDIAQARC